MPAIARGEADVAQEVIVKIAERAPRSPHRSIGLKTSGKPAEETGAAIGGGSAGAGGDGCHGRLHQ
jgi:hypothetical protein